MFAVDLNPAKLAMAKTFGAIGIPADAPAVAEIQRHGGADVALDLVGSATVMRQALECLRPMGRAVAVGLTPDTFPVGPYTDLVTGESELIGASDHLRSEIVELLDHAAEGRFALDAIVDHRVGLNANEVNDALDGLERFGDSVRSVIVPVSL